LLRPGAIGVDQVQAVCGLRVLQKQELSTLAAPAPKASGTLNSHYAPQARVRLLRAVDLRLALQAVQGARLVDLAPEASSGHSPVLAVWSRSVTNTEVPGVLHVVMPDDAGLAAQQLFAQLRAFDAQGVTEIWIETPPAATAWDGVRDRLQRAAH